MTYALKALTLLILATTGQSFVWGRSAKNANGTLTWPKKYHFQAQRIYATAGLVEPLECWYKEGKSRKDVYGGIVKRFYEFDSLEKIVYTIYPKVKKLENTVGCFSKPIEKNEHLQLPSFENDTYYLKGVQREGNKVLETWEAKKQDEEDGLYKENTVIVYRNRKSQYFPVEHTYKSYRNTTNGIKDHIITMYSRFNTKFDDDIVDFDKQNEVDIYDCDEMNSKDNQDLFPEVFDIDTETLFHGYKHRHGKIYDQHEHKIRKDIFINNLRYVMEHNRKNLSYTLQMNHFADQSDEEMNAMVCDLPPKTVSYFDEPIEKYVALSSEILPGEWDSRTEGLVTPVKNQLYCGSCWAFASTALIETAVAKKESRLLDLSEQSLIDCSWDFGNYGCNGGMRTGSLNFIQHFGIATDMEYGPYLMENGVCHLKNVSEIYKITKIGQVDTEDVRSMKSVLFEYGAIVVGIHADKHMKLYSSGIYNNPSCGNHVFSNHAVIIVGYGVRDGVLYWIVKNSWGTSWGQEGYMLITSKKANGCDKLFSGNYVVA